MSKKKLVGDINTGYQMMDAEEYAKSMVIVEGISKIMAEKEKKSKHSGDQIMASLYAESLIPRIAYNEITKKNGYASPDVSTVYITNVIFNEPATVVCWSDNTKTIVKAIDEPFDEEKGLAMAIAKKALGNRGNYYNHIKKWIDKE